MLFHATRCVVGHEALENEWYVVLQVCRFWDFERFLYYNILHVCAIPTYRVYWLHNSGLLSRLYIHTRTHMHTHNIPPQTHTHHTHHTVQHLMHLLGKVEPLQVVYGWASSTVTTEQCWTLLEPLFSNQQELTAWMCFKTDLYTANQCLGGVTVGMKLG